MSTLLNIAAMMAAVLIAAGVALALVFHSPWDDDLEDE